MELAGKTMTDELEDDGKEPVARACTVELCPLSITTSAFS
jgi:hypothetical protein